MKDEIEKSLDLHRKVSFRVLKPINARDRACSKGSILTFSKTERSLIAKVAGAGMRFVVPLKSPEVESIIPFGEKPKRGRPPKAKAEAVADEE